MSLNISFQQIREGNREDPGRKPLSLAILSQKGMNVTGCAPCEKGKTMAEGPFVHYYTKQLRSALEGRDIRIEFRLCNLRDVNCSLGNIHIQRVEPHGKQFRIHFPDHRILLIHLMMWGSWRIYRKGESWDKHIRLARVTFYTNSHRVVAFSAPPEEAGKRLQGKATRSP